PDWARQTLQRRAGDLREQLLSWEELARGRSGSSLWDQAQRSLLQNGELHNNLRMTWGKAVLDWTPGPGEALRLLIDLNHRYALDGSDPNSYGGLLWCLGQFDRAFEPEREVLGTVRPRPVDDHADRLRPQRYASAVDARRGYDPIRVAVVGAGISGLACARTLADQGVDVCVLDRGRGPGGRTSTRQSRDSTGATFDHGAPFFQVADARFGRYVRSWIEQGICSKWAAGAASWREGSLVAVPPDAPLIVGTPGMSAICEHLASDLDVRTGQVVSTLRPSAPGWLLETGEAAQTDRFDAVVLAMAPEQARRLLGGDASSMREQLAGIASHPVWAGMFILENADPGLPDVVRFEPEHDLGLLVRNDHKPGRASLPAGRTALVAHASSRWSSARLDASREAVADEFAELVDQWLRAGDLGGRVVSRAAHRWGLARPASQIAGACLFDRDRALAVCGDGFAGTGVEAAFLSGQAAAGRVLSLRRAATPTATEAGPLFASGSDDHAQRGGAG
ncbi:MAG: FAD-dependent oxidoreductase, partial [Planctomycetota bacterium]